MGSVNRLKQGEKNMDNQKQNKYIKVWVSRQVFFWMDIELLFKFDVFSEPWSNYRYGN